MKQILHLDSVKNVTFKSSYNWFKINILRLVLPLTAILSPVQGHLNSYEYIIYYLYIVVDHKQCSYSRSHMAK